MAMRSIISSENPSINEIECKKTEGRIVSFAVIYYNCTVKVATTWIRLSTSLIKELPDFT